MKMRLTSAALCPGTGYPQLPRGGDGERAAAVWPEVPVEGPSVEPGGAGEGTPGRGAERMPGRG